MNIEIANRLVELRKQKGLSQEELADKLGISRQAVSKWERAEAGPDVDNAIRLSRLYGISLDELFGNKPDYERAIEAMRRREEAAEGAQDASESPTDDPFAAGPEGPFDSPAEPPHVPADGGESFYGIDCLVLDRVRASVRVSRSPDSAVHIKTEGPDDERRRCRVGVSGSRLTVVTEQKKRLFFGFGGQTVLRIVIEVPDGFERVEAQLVGGDLELSGVRIKRLEGVTGGGDVTAKLVTADSAEFSTGGGDIYVEALTAGRASGKTGGGDIEVSRIEVENGLMLTTGGGDIKAGGRAAELILRTGGGDVRADMEAASADVKSGGGDVKLRLVGAGSVTAKTGGGEIRITLVGVSGLACDAASVGGRSGVVWQGEQLASGRSITLRAGDGSTRVDAKSGGGDITVAAE